VSQTAQIDERRLGMLAVPRRVRYQLALERDQQKERIARFELLIAAAKSALAVIPRRDAAVSEDTQTLRDTELRAPGMLPRATRLGSSS
jgi:hypothetical protein